MYGTNSSNALPISGVIVFNFSGLFKVIVATLLLSENLNSAGNSGSFIVIYAFLLTGMLALLFQAMPSLQSQHHLDLHRSQHLKLLDVEQ